MTLAELIARKQADGEASPDAARALGIPPTSVEWMATGPLVTHGRPWRPTPDIVEKIGRWLGETPAVVRAAIAASTQEKTNA